MSRIYVATILALTALQLAASPAMAQVIFAPGGGGGIDTAIQGRATVRDDIYTCQAAPGGSRVRENCDVVTEIEQLEQQQKMAKLLKPLQTVCLENNLPDLSALVIQKPKARSDFGNLLRPSDGWWEPYVTRGEATVGDVPFWFKHYQTARDYPEWPETPFF